MSIISQLKKRDGLRLLQVKTWLILSPKICRIFSSFSLLSDNLLCIHQLSILPSNTWELGYLALRSVQVLSLFYLPKLSFFLWQMCKERWKWMSCRLLLYLLSRNRRTETTTTKSLSAIENSMGKCDDETFQERTSLVVQWLGLHASNAVGQVWILIGEVGCHRPENMAKK